MEPISDVACADWLPPLLDRSARDMHGVVPHGYQAYARVFHPATRDRPADTGTWRGHSRPTASEIDVEPVSWSRVAEAFGTSMHPLAQFHRLIRPQSADYHEVIDAAGWRYGAPHPGNLDVRVLARLVSILCRHTASPHSGVAAVWEGWGGLTSPAGFSRLILVDADSTSTVPSSGTDGGSGLLPAAVVNGPRLELPGRAHFLFTEAPIAFASPGWIRTAPWTRDAHWPQSPSLIWPADRVWTLVTEIDFDSKVIGGSQNLISEIVADPRIEALQIPEGADLTWDADKPNRPTS
jgi:hypothetical protein